MNRFWITGIILFWFLVNPVFSQNNAVDTSYTVIDTIPGNLSLFDRDDILEISLSFDITYYRKKKPDEEYLDAKITYYQGADDSITKDIKVRSRGFFRREYCDFPPLLLNFREKDPPGMEFSRVNKLKLVTLCKKGYEDYLLREFLIYKLYNALTDKSLKVRLMRINYINTAKGNKSFREFAFAIEPVEFFSERTKTFATEAISISRDRIEPEWLDRLALFNYMIGNTDWSVYGQHNVIVLSQGLAKKSDLGLIVPYDFDYSGLVNTHYAAPAKGLTTKSVRERVYLGPCRDRETFIKALEEFPGKKDEFYRIIREFPYLKEKSRNDMIRYLDSFYDGFDKRNTNVISIMNDCESLSYK